ncbi:MAG TPA: class I adenylate-forming enzyme family protein [Gemmatimonadales bacterium]|nr:class I adenylate-forming enzyme family protein [Gemmatimonadales bacterium]
MSGWHAAKQRGQSMRWGVMPDGMLAAIVLTPLVVWSLFICWRLGLHQRLPLAFSRIALDRIPDRAARMHGQRPLFTCDRPAAWTVPALHESYPDPLVWSAERILRTVDWLARMLRGLPAFEHGARVAILKDNHFDMHLLMQGIVRAGGIAAPLNDGFATDMVESYLAHVGASVLISDTRTLLRVLDTGGALAPGRTVILAEARKDGDAAQQRVLAVLRERSNGQVHFIEEALAAATPQAVLPQRDSGEVLYVVHSSGTTGFPKAVMLRNEAQSHAVRGWLSYVHLSRTRDRGYLAVPNNHQAVILTFNSALLLGLPLHWSSPYTRGTFDPARTLRELASGGYTGFFAFPVAYTELKEHPLEPLRLRKMRFWASTADATHEAIIKRFVAVGGAFRSIGIPQAGAIYLDAQGSSEVGTPSVVRYYSRFTRRWGRRIGKPGSTPFGPSIRIADGDGNPVARGEVGRLEVRGRTVFRGYWNDHAMSVAAIRRGWFFTGDMMRLSEDGHLVQLDREVDVIHTARGPVYSLPIEEVLHKDPAVFDACVFGARQRDGTQSPAAAIVPREGMTIDAASLRARFNQHLSERERLADVRLVRWDEMPIGLTGKSLKRVFREASEGAASPDVS